MANSKHAPPPPVRKEPKLSHLTLYFPVTAKMGNTKIYKLNENGLKLVRVIAVNLEDRPGLPPC